jgi:hypothetical protein
MSFILLLLKEYVNIVRIRIIIVFAVMICYIFMSIMLVIIMIL